MHFQNFAIAAAAVLPIVTAHFNNHHAIPPRQVSSSGVDETTTTITHIVTLMPTSTMELVEPEPTQPVFPDFASIPTRCNPANLTEVQRFQQEEMEWFLHAVCPHKHSCVDVSGMGACRIEGNNFLLPTANDTTDLSKPVDIKLPVVYINTCSSSVPSATATMKRS